MPSPTNSFPQFSSFPPELRLKIWSIALALTPARTLPFSLLKSDLDYLRLRRKACHNYPHIFCSRMPVPSLLHCCRESRHTALQNYAVGFEIFRILSLGRGDTDVETYTTCSHEVALDELHRGVYWDKTKDVVLLDDKGRLDERGSAYVWGGRTGVRFGRMKRVAMTWEAVMSAGFGSMLQWESLEVMYVVYDDAEAGFASEAPRMGTIYANETRAPEVVARLLRGGKIMNSESGPVDLKFYMGSLKQFRKYIAEGAP
ncbi:uncharacterized protein BP5553_09740 [Venustampulla echinocandica]|uniref:2EXR domain-containing protein n=1 Tax=Venustampulla echinocandica TaxID=2656787 RepID=A0A370TBV1_9HELO|nr:uncharacterized protein BP5553_09740 [Venustampulla echinocandica]RDL31531.1 hypothetical protein BP5553_09740 [Venustampulla echinocandica]